MSEPNPVYEKIKGGVFVPARRKPGGIFIEEVMAKRYDGWRILALLEQPTKPDEPDDIWAWLAPISQNEELNLNQMS